MPSLWRLQHAGALAEHPALLVWARDRREPSRPGPPSRPRAGCRLDHEPSQRPRQGRARARRGQGTQAHRALRRRGRGRAARRAGGRHRARSRPSSTTTSAAIASPTSWRRRARPCCAARRGAWPRCRRSRTRAAPSACSVPTICRRWRPGTPSAGVGLHLHGVSDPGNLGTLLRSAQGFGPAHVALADGCADPLSPRAVRASMGALYARAGHHPAARPRRCP